MREKLMATRMRYLQTAVKQLRDLISTRELSTNQFLLRQLALIEQHLKHMEDAYVYTKET